ncbi:MAG: glycine zipper 2TM domain-containing protein [Steroidobacteraceae bacterium]
MNKQLIIGVIVGAVAITAVAAFAGYKNMDTKTASAPRQECRDVLVTVTRPTKDPDQIAGTVTGAVVGGVIGHQIGSGDGNKLATAGGAIAGGIAGHKIQEGMQERNTYQEVQQVCETVQ